MSNPPTVSHDVLALTVLNPLRNGRSSLIDAGKTINGVMDLYSRLGDEASAGAVAEWLYDLADIVQRISVRIEQIGAEA